MSIHPHFGVTSNLHFAIFIFQFAIKDSLEARRSQLRRLRSDTTPLANTREGVYHQIL